jgi:histone H3/H4
MDSKPELSREYTVSDLLRKIDPSATIDPLAEEFVLDVVDDFIDSVVGLAADCARNRGGQAVQVEDVAYVLQRKFGEIGLGTPQGVQRPPDFIGNEAHLKRLKAVEEARQKAAEPQKAVEQTGQ